METQGIIVGCDRHQQWLLPWWWEHYIDHNSYPVAFADFGMTKGALAWCQTKGECVQLPQLEFTAKPVSEKNRILWESLYGDTVWSSRPGWFKKPLALTLSPFSRGMWLDLDCQVKGSLEPLFNSLCLGAELALVREPDYVQDIERGKGLLIEGEISYNSGVVVFRREAKVLEVWKTMALEENHLFIGDQNVLSRAITQEKPLLLELPHLFNWKHSYGPNPDALIHHFLGQAGKQEIVRQLASNANGALPA